MRFFVFFEYISIQIIRRIDFDILYENLALKFVVHPVAFTKTTI